MKLEAGEVLEAGRSHVIKRPRLTRLLDETDARIILLVAPAGYGKTTLAREWLSTRPHAWYRGTSATADVAALALGLAKAASAVVEGAGERMTTRLRISGAPTEEVVELAELLAEDLSDWPSEAWLVFDDYQFACDSDPAERFVDLLTTLSPIRLLVISRSRPAWATARRVVYGEVYEIGRSLLFMDQDEAHAVLRKCAAEPEGLVALADGWPALIGLAAIGDERAIPANGVPVELYNYFAEELYRAVTPSFQQALRRLSLSPWITLEIAESLIGDSAAHVLNEAAELGFFLTTSSGKFEFHPLLRSFLTSKFVAKTDDPHGCMVSDLAHQLIEQERWDDSFDLIERFFDAKLLIELIEAALTHMVDEARVPTLVRWIQTAAAHRLDSPVIDFADAEIALKEGDLRRAEALATQALRRFPEEHEFESKALALSGISAYLTSREEAALEHFNNARRAAHSEADRRQALWGCFLAMARLDQVTEAQTLLEELEAVSGTSVDELLRIATGCLILGSLQGALLQRLGTVDDIAPLAERSRDPLVHSSFLNVYAALLVSSGRYSDGRKSAEREIEVAVAYDLTFVLPHARFHLSAALWGLRDFRGCRTSLAACEKAVMTGGDAFLQMNIGVLRARSCLIRGTTSEALEIFDRYQHPPSSKSMEAEYLAWWSLACAVAGEATQAKALADRAVSMSPRVEVTGLTPWTKAVLALIGRRSTGSAAEDAFRVALETGNIDAFVTAYRARPELLRMLASNPDHHERLKTILERARDHKLAETVGLRLPSAPEFEGPSILSKREREVLQLVAQGLSNKEIGRTLYITESTAKVHVRKICRKLGLRSRTEAAARIGELSD